MTRLSETVILAPKYRRGLPCSSETYCSRDCKRRISGRYGWECLRNNHCRTRGYYYQNEDIPVTFCAKMRCQYLLQSDKGSRIICEKFANELKQPTRPPSGHTTLRLRWKESGWTYRKV
ncbi:MAG TPA: hypothetical protein VMW36_08280, partial [Patescibacteria group bacterium]|nr:hypothetical protein [Patescibacteria group bacterium]